DVDLARERRAAEAPQVDRHHDVPRDAEVFRDVCGLLDLDAVTLAVVEGQRIEREALRARDGGRGGGIEASAQKDDRLSLPDGSLMQLRVGSSTTPLPSADSSPS